MMHLLIRSLFLLAVSAAAATLSAVLMAKFSAKMRGIEQEGREDVAAAAASAPQHQPVFLPFQSVGLNYEANAGLRGVGALMRRLGPVLEALGTHVNESVLIPAVCLPVALYYWGRVALARAAPEASQ